MSSDEDDDALQSTLLKTFDKALMDLMASNEVEIEYFAVPSGATAFHVYITPHARDILSPLAARLGQSVDDLIHRFQIERAVQPSIETH